jgi:SAM-dependent methyltransferase
LNGKNNKASVLAFGISHILKRVLLRRSAFSGSYGKLRMLYAMEDPWEMSSAKEQYRFEFTNAHLADIAPRFGTILELGCGEGHQSAYLARMADELSGVDISPWAIDRARKRCPDGRFKVGKAEDARRLFANERFDLVTACEVLCYAPDIEAILVDLQSITDRLYVSNYEARAEAMRHYFAGPGWSVLPPIRYDNTVWECHLWERPLTA